MRCADAGELMHEILDGGANSDRKAALLAHAADCVACRAEWSALQRVDGLLAAAPSVSPPADFTSKVMAHLARRRPAQNPWVGALALFAGTVTLACIVLFSLAGPGPTVSPTALLGPGGAAWIRVGSTLLGWAQAGWEIRQVVLSVVPSGLILLYAVLALVALAMWLGLVAGIQGALRPASK